MDELPTGNFRSGKVARASEDRPGDDVVPVVRPGKTNLDLSVGRAAPQGWDKSKQTLFLPTNFAMVRHVSEE